MDSEYVLCGVMHFVDKWLDNEVPYYAVDDPDGYVAIGRAATAREKTLNIIEDLQRENMELEKKYMNLEKQHDALLHEIDQLTLERDAAIQDLKLVRSCTTCKNLWNGTQGESWNGLTCSKCEYEWRGV